MLVSERIGQFFLDTGDRLEYTEFGAGERLVVLLHPQLMTRRVQQPLARTLASQGLHVVTLDLLGHGRSDRPADPLAYSVPAFAAQVLALLDHLGAERAVVGGTSLGANVALQVAVSAPDRVRGLVVEMPLLDNALTAGLLAGTPLLLAARFAPFTVAAVRRATRAVPRGVVPFWVGVWLDSCNQRSGPLAAVLHGVLFGSLAPSAEQRRSIRVPVLVVGHDADPLHPAADAEMLAGELPRSRFVRARSIMEWRLAPERLDAEAVRFVLDAWDARRTRPRRRGTAH
ncbi:alpha/beta fold hydrolase [Nocardioides houyundeii]|uniref:alpha/beta fold hydrolase n=1 Tax=Nocardioides houyundeii TaxID=2045452 RepID=UPI000C77772C|nr:alpha/beta hydrolase [Nocardioides houyundeii]